MRGVVISGPTGAIGMALMEKCIKQKVQTLAICHRGSSRIGQIPDSPYVRIVEADLSEYRNLFAENSKDWEDIAGQNYEVFYHFAWSGTTGEQRNDMRLQTGNIAYTLDAVDLAARLGCHTFIGAGSQAEYGRVSGKLTPDLPAYPENGYGMAKLCAGQMSRAVCAQKHIRHIWARVLSVYGPYDGAGSMIMSAVRKIRNGEDTAFTPGRQLWDYLYSGDAAEIFYALGEKGVDGEVYCVGSGQARELRSYIMDIYRVVQEYRGDAPAQGGTRESADEEVTKKGVTEEEVTEEEAADEEVTKKEVTEEEAGLERLLGIGRLPYGEKQVMHLCADTTLLGRRIGKIPHTDFREGIRRILETEQCT